jgi:hypothetical protein
VVLLAPAKPVEPTTQVLFSGSAAFVCPGLGSIRAEVAECRSRLVDRRAGKWLSSITASPIRVQRRSWNADLAFADGVEL